MRRIQHAAGCAIRQRRRMVVAINADSDAVDMLDGLLDAGRYDMVFVDAGADAYSLVRRMLPDHVIVFMRIDEAVALPLLSLLASSIETRRIPMSLCVTQLVCGETGDEEQPAGLDNLPVPSQLTMH